MEHLTSQHEADMVALHRQYEEDLAAMQSKFDAMYFLCKNLAKEVKKKDEKIELLKEGDRIQKILSQQQQQLARSAITLIKRHRTRFIMGEHSVVYRPTDTRP